MYYNKEYREGFPREFLLPTAVGSPLTLGTIPTVFLYFIYRSRPPKMLKYLEKHVNNKRKCIKTNKL